MGNQLEMIVYSFFCNYYTYLASSICDVSGSVNYIFPFVSFFFYLFVFPTFSLCTSLSFILSFWLSLDKGCLLGGQLGS